MKEIIINTDNVEKPNEHNTFLENRRIVYDTKGCELSICIMAYNRLEKTKLCVESVLEHTKNIDYILVLADNGSTDGTYEYFKSVKYENKVLIKITKNITGVYGSNQILRHIRTKYYALLGNDTIMTYHWMDNMLKCIKSDERIGMVTPLSTNTNIYQLPDIPAWNSFEELQEIAREHNQSDPTKWKDFYRLIPIVALYRMEVFDIVGKYDPGYFHEFTEDDHEIRIRRNGYRIVLCGDTFIHHNHLVEERTDYDVRLLATKSGKNNYQTKFCGIDAWDDIDNHIIAYANYIKEVHNTEVKILGIDTKCGTPILDVSNRYRELGVRNSVCYGYTTDVKYYSDLQTICEQVISDDIKNIRLHFQAETFDCIVTDTPINMYQAPLNCIMELLSLVKKGGYLLIPLKNNYDIRAFLNMFGVIDLMENAMPVQLHYSLVFSKLHELQVKKIDVSYSMHNINMDLAELIRKQYVNTGLVENANEEFDKLLIENYWFIVKK